MRFWSETSQAVEATVAQTSGLVYYFFFRQTGYVFVTTAHALTDSLSLNKTFRRL